MTQFRRFQFVMIAVVAVLCMFAMVAICSGQEATLTNGGNGLFQEVAITYKGKDYSFHRQSSDYRYKPLHWGEWEQWPMNRKDQKARMFPTGGLNPNLDQREVSKMMGPAMLKWLDEQQTVSGYYNFTGNPLYDWESFGGDSYGTYSKKKLSFMQTKTGYDFLDLSKFRLPILKGEK